MDVNDKRLSVPISGSTPVGLCRKKSLSVPSIPYEPPRSSAKSFLSALDDTGIEVGPHEDDTDVKYVTCHGSTLEATAPNSNRCNTPLFQQGTPQDNAVMPCLPMKGGITVNGTNVLIDLKEPVNKEPHLNLSDNDELHKADENLKDSDMVSPECKIRFTSENPTCNDIITPSSISSLRCFNRGLSPPVENTAGLTNGMTSTPKHDQSLKVRKHACEEANNIVTNNKDSSKSSDSKHSGSPVWFEKDNLVQTAKQPRGIIQSEIETVLDGKCGSEKQTHDLSCHRQKPTGHAMVMSRSPLQMERTSLVDVTFGDEAQAAVGDGTEFTDRDGQEYENKEIETSTDNLDDIVAQCVSNYILRGHVTPTPSTTSKQAAKKTRPPRSPRRIRRSSSDSGSDSTPPRRRASRRGSYRTGRRKPQKTRYTMNKADYDPSEIREAQV